MSIVSTTHDAERLAAQIMKDLGYKGVRLTNGGPTAASMSGQTMESLK
ncbi:hypothetical protein [Nocardia cyriacigeorgica]|nr:hypothetical protein [Nocardia cyriacigeorgica]